MDNYREKINEIALQFEKLDLAKINVKNNYETVSNQLMEQKKYLDNLYYYGSPYNAELSKFCEEEYYECKDIERHINDDYEEFCEETRKVNIMLEHRQNELNLERQENKKYGRDNQNQQK